MQARIETLKIKNKQDEEYLVYPRTLIKCVTNEHGANLQELIDNTILNAEGGVYVDYDQTPTEDYVPVDADKFKGYDIDHFATAKNIEDIANGNTVVAKAANAEKATFDSENNKIVDTYSTKIELDNKTITLQNEIDTKVSQNTTVNGYALNTNITLNYTDVGADASGSADSALSSANSYTDTSIANLINGAPTTLDTLKEVADAMADNQEVVEALDEAIGKKADQTALNTHTSNGTIHITADERTTWNNKANGTHTHTKSQITDFPTSMPASDVYSWAKAASKPSYTWNEIISKPSTFTPSSHSHSGLYQPTDTRAVATKPSDYSNSLEFFGLKNSATVGSPSGDTYAYILGLKGWTDPSGGNAHELAFTNSGIFARLATSDSAWGAWKKFITSLDIGSQSVNYANSAGTISNQGSAATKDIVMTTTDPGAGAASSYKEGSIIAVYE